MKYEPEIIPLSHPLADDLERLSILVVLVVLYQLRQHLQPVGVLLERLGVQCVDFMLEIINRNTLTR